MPSQVRATRAARSVALKMCSALVVAWLWVTAAQAQEPGLVMIRQKQSQSSGVIVAEQLVLTSDHGTNQGEVTVNGLPAEVIASSKAFDLALLKVPGLEGTVQRVAAEGQ